MCQAPTSAHLDQRTAHPAVRHPLRIAIVGKGGAGKTTVAGALARTLAAQGRRVLALDADPDANLASVLPLDGEQRPQPLARQQALLHAATDAGTLPVGLFQLNPDTGDLLLRGTVTWGGGNPLVALGWGKAGGEGCYCAEHAVLRRLLFDASALPAEVTLIDSEAGLEHLSRGTIAGVDLVLVVVEPGQRSLETAIAVRRLAGDLGIARVHAVVCGYRDHAELLRLRCWLGDWPAVAAFPYDEQVRAADLAGTPPVLAGEFLAAAETLAASVLQLDGTLQTAHA
ncbi:AAA family ATPase [Thiobaca trueperi]|uniref:CO dehydrogenase maturation factor n=1 Tax=Thiobaca trueperi TaxID=127458 RepID=A0A4R3MXG6_9GAMM|nr:AAA family ATPase [Thiobaca trueperi]TCT19443.1 CO dehydrogenase maturation factor [Thiobaca trueperi]